MLKANPLKFEIYEFLARLYEEAGNKARALANYEQALLLAPNQPENYLHTAGVELELKQIRSRNRYPGRSKTHGSQFRKSPIASRLFFQLPSVIPRLCRFLKRRCRRPSRTRRSCSTVASTSIMAQRQNRPAWSRRLRHCSKGRSNWIHQRRHKPIITSATCGSIGI